MVTAKYKIFDEEVISFYNRVKSSIYNQVHIISEYSSTQNFINLITQFIFTITVYHNLVGLSAEFVAYPTRDRFRILANLDSNQIDIQIFISTYLCNVIGKIHRLQLMSKNKNFFRVYSAPL